MMIESLVIIKSVHVTKLFLFYILVNNYSVITMNMPWVEGNMAFF